MMRCAGRGSPLIRQELDRIVRSLKAFVESAIALIFPSATTPPNANLIEHTPRQPIQKGRGNRVRKTHEYCEDWSAIVGLASDALAQTAEPTFKGDPSVYKVIFEDANFRVIEANRKKGVHDKTHGHPVPSVVYNVTDCKTKQYAADGTVRETDSKAGWQTLFRSLPRTPPKTSVRPTASKSSSRTSSFSHRAHAISFGVANSGYDPVATESKIITGLASRCRALPRRFL